MKRIFKEISLLITLFPMGELYASAGEDSYKALRPDSVITSWGNQAVIFDSDLVSEQAVESLMAATRLFVKHDTASRELDKPASHSRPDKAVSIILNKLGEYIASGKTLAEIHALYPSLESISLAVNALAAQPDDRALLQAVVLSISAAAQDLAPGMDRHDDGFFVFNDMDPAHYESLRDALLSLIA